MGYFASIAYLFPVGFRNSVSSMMESNNPNQRRHCGRVIASPLQQRSVSFERLLSHPFGNPSQSGTVKLNAVDIIEAIGERPQEFPFQV